MVLPNASQPPSADENALTALLALEFAGKTNVDLSHLSDAEKIQIFTEYRVAKILSGETGISNITHTAVAPHQMHATIDMATLSNDTQTHIGGILGLTPGTTNFNTNTGSQYANLLNNPTLLGIERNKIRAKLLRFHDYIYNRNGPGKAVDQLAKLDQLKIDQKLVIGISPDLIIFWAKLRKLAEMKVAGSPLPPPITPPGGTAPAGTPPHIPGTVTSLSTPPSTPAIAPKLTVENKTIIAETLPVHITGKVSHKSHEVELRNQNGAPFATRLRATNIDDDGAFVIEIPESQLNGNILRYQLWETDPTGTHAPSRVNIIVKNKIPPRMKPVDVDLFRDTCDQAEAARNIPKDYDHEGVKVTVVCSPREKYRAAIFLGSKNLGTVDEKNRDKLLQKVQNKLSEDHAVRMKKHNEQWPETPTPQQPITVSTTSGAKKTPNTPKSEENEELKNHKKKHHDSEDHEKQEGTFYDRMVGWISGGLLGVRNAIPQGVRTFGGNTAASVRNGAIVGGLTGVVAAVTGSALLSGFAFPVGIGVGAITLVRRYMKNKDGGGESKGH